MGSQPNATSDRLLTTMFLVVMVALGGPAFIGTAASDGSPWDWFLLTVWVCAVLGAAWTTRRAWRTPFTPGMASETCPASSLTENRQLSTNWLRTVWFSALLLATLAGGYVGAVTSTTIVGIRISVESREEREKRVPGQSTGRGAGCLGIPRHTAAAGRRYPSVISIVGALPRARGSDPIQ